MAGLSHVRPQEKKDKEAAEPKYPADTGMRRAMRHGCFFGVKSEVGDPIAFNSKSFERQAPGEAKKDGMGCLNMLDQVAAQFVSCWAVISLVGWYGAKFRRN